MLEFLARRIVSNVRELEGALNRIIAYASFVGKPVTLEVAQDVLSDLLRASEKRVTIDEIQRRVAEYFNVRMSDMLSARRARAVCPPAPDCHVSCQAIDHAVAAENWPQIWRA